MLITHFSTLITVFIRSIGRFAFKPLHLNYYYLLLANQALTLSSATTDNYCDLAVHSDPLEYLQFIRFATAIMPSIIKSLDLVIKLQYAFNYV